MTLRASSTAIVLAVLAITPALAQERPTPQPSVKGSGTTDTQARTSASQTKLPITAIHVTGCVARAADFVKTDRLEGAGTPVPPDRDQYVLTRATQPSTATASDAGRRDGRATATAGRAPAPASPSAAHDAVATTGQASAPRGGAGAYGLAGDREPEFEQYVGRRVEVIGQFEPNQGMIPPGPSAEPSAKTLPVITIASFRAVEGSCK